MYGFIKDGNVTCLKAGDKVEINYVLGTVSFLRGDKEMEIHHPNKGTKTWFQMRLLEDSSRLQAEEFLFLIAVITGLKATLLSPPRNNIVLAFFSNH